MLIWSITNPLPFLSVGNCTGSCPLCKQQQESAEPGDFSHEVSTTVTNHTQVTGPQDKTPTMRKHFSPGLCPLIVSMLGPGTLWTNTAFGQGSQVLEATLIDTFPTAQSSRFPRCWVLKGNTGQQETRGGSRCHPRPVSQVSCQKSLQF